MRTAECHAFPRGKVDCGVSRKTDEGPVTESRAVTVHLPSPDGATLFQKRALGGTNSEAVCAARMDNLRRRKVVRLSARRGERGGRKG